MPYTITEIPNKLADRLKNATNEIVLFCDYNFALMIDYSFEFWLNGNHFLERVNKTEVRYFVINFLEKNYPKFVNFKNA